MEGYQDMNYQTVEGYQVMREQIVEGYQDMQNQTVKGEIHIIGMKQGDEEAQKILDEFYETEQEKYTIGTLIKWLKRQAGEETE